MNFIREENWSALLKPIIVVKVPARAVKGVPCFTEAELKWLRENVLETEALNFLYSARLEDHRYQILPDELHVPPLADTPAESARSECFNFINNLRPGRRAGA